MKNYLCYLKKPFLLYKLNTYVLKKYLLIYFLLLTTFSQSLASPSDTGYCKLSEMFLYAVKTDNSSNTFVEKLKKADRETLHKQLSDDAHKKAFWLNIYNAFVQKLLTENPGKFKDRNSFFSSKQIIIAGIYLSLDDIEHGLLRRSKIEWGKGHLNKLFPPEFEKQFRVDTMDYRIHFALNCGAKSCPPIAYYDPEKIDKQLDIATEHYLESEVVYNKVSDLVLLPKIMDWYGADFGGKKGMIFLLKKYGIIAENADVQIQFKKYDWTLFLDNYKS